MDFLESHSMYKKMMEDYDERQYQKDEFLGCICFAGLFFAGFILTILFMCL